MIPGRTRYTVPGMLLAVALSTVSANSLADYGSTTVSQLRYVYDADSIKVDLADLPPIIGENVMVRINGVDAPELRALCDNEKQRAREAKQWLVERLRSADVIELRHMERGKYFRIVADVYADGVDVGQELIAAGLAVSYNGGTKSNPWCAS